LVEWPGIHIVEIDKYSGVKARKGGVEKKE